MAIDLSLQLIGKCCSNLALTSAILSKEYSSKQSITEVVKVLHHTCKFLDRPMIHALFSCQLLLLAISWEFFLSLILMTENNLTNKNGTAKLFPTRLCPLNLGGLTLIAASIATTKNITNTKQTQSKHFFVRCSRFTSVWEDSNTNFLVLKKRFVKNLDMIHEN